MYSDAELIGYLSDFGETATINGAAVLAVYRRDYVESMDIDGYTPTLICRASDVATVPRGAAVLLGSAAYTVYGIEPRSDGLTKIILKATS